MDSDLPPVEAADLQIKHLGPRGIHSPLSGQLGAAHAYRFVEDKESVLLDDSLESVQRFLAEGKPVPAIEKAGPRESIFFNPADTTCAVVACGGLCPGINDVIRGIVMELYYRYGVRDIYGIRYGYEGLIKRYGHEIRNLRPDRVDGIHHQGGSILGSSRGHQDVGEIVDSLQRMSVNILFVIGGDGTLKGALDIAREVEKRDLQISVIGIPKTIDNDIMFLDKSFGFETAFAEAVKSINSAHIEAKGGVNGVGLVKLMGRHSGFIACFAALALNDVNFVLIPEVPVRLEGENGFLEALRQRLLRRQHAVVVVAEGAGQDLVDGDRGTDASGNVRLKDIGLFLRERIIEHFSKIGMEVNLKYIDPSYLIRSVPASPQDSVYCSRLAQNAVHAGMAGKTEMVVGRWRGHFVNIPTRLTTSGRRRVDPAGDLWQSVLEATGQPVEFR